MTTTPEISMRQAELVLRLYELRREEVMRKPVAMLAVLFYPVLQMISLHS